MSGPVAAGPGVPVNDKPPGQGPGGEGGEQSLDLRDGQRDHAGLGGRRLVGPDRGRCLGVGAVSRDFTGSARCGRDPLPGADEHVPGLVSHIGQMNGVDPVGHLPRTPPGTGVSRPGSRRLFLTGLVDRADHHPASPPAPCRLFQAVGREPAYHAHRGGGVSAHVVQSRWVRSGVRSRPCQAILHSFTRGSSLTSADTYLPACSHGFVRARHGRSSASSSFRFRSPDPAPRPFRRTSQRHCPALAAAQARVRCRAPTGDPVIVSERV